MVAADRTPAAAGTIEADGFDVTAIDLASGECFATPSRSLAKMSDIMKAHNTFRDAAKDGALKVILTNGAPR